MRLLPGLLCMIVALSAAAKERPDEFAYSVPLELSDDSALYQLQIPPSVYEGVARADLAAVAMQLAGDARTQPLGGFPGCAQDPHQKDSSTA